MKLKNTLNESSSPYLRDAADQPVHWQQYSDEVFKLAQELKRPILLDVGAVWCHWCHVMDMESYSDIAIGEFINNHFIPVKVDRDQMPDVDSRYQAAVGALTGAGGWPLTAFLTPDGKVFYGGTYFPKNDMGGRQGMFTVLRQVADVYADRPIDVTEGADELFRRLTNYEAQSTNRGEISASILNDIVADASSRFDESLGGFGGSPKFFNPTALLLLSEEALKPDGQVAKDMLLLTLDSIAAGGVYDQLGGGFHRYSVDRYWHVPHFEKMLSDNALMLKVFLAGLQVSPKSLYRRVAIETADWIIGAMKSTEGPFFAHQDADVDANDDGTFWTWTEEELQCVLSVEEKSICDSYFDIRKSPKDIHDFPERNVLRVALAENQIAHANGYTVEEVDRLLRGAKKKLLEQRSRRKAPFIDKTIYVDRNSLAISALVQAAIDLKERRYFDAAEIAANFIMREMIDEDGKVAHAYFGKVLYDGLLDDNVYFGLALLDLFDAGRSDSYLALAETIGEVLLTEFEDTDSGGFFDRALNAKGEGLLKCKRKPIDDTPTPSGNSGAAIFFDRLLGITENATYFEVANRTLKAFAGSASRHGIYAAEFARAVRMHLRVSRSVR